MNSDREFVDSIFPFRDSVLPSQGTKPVPISIKYTETVVGDTPRIQLTSPFEAKDAIKLSMVARWEERRKVWTIPYTRLALRKVVDSIAKRHPGATQTFDSAIEAMLKKPICVGEIKVSEFPNAVFPPWDHQKIGSSMIGELEGCMLAWDMGSGKTKGVYDAIIQYGMRFIFIACPTSVISVWRKQFFIHMPESMRASTTLLALDSGQSIERRATMVRDAYEQMKHDKDARLIVVINYEAAWRESFAKVVRTIPWDLAVADESHRIANHTTRSCKFMAGVIAPVAKHRVCLSGTPLGNGPIDAFGQFMFAEPALFGQSLTRFRSEYCVMGGYEGRQVIDYRNMDAFRATMATITSRVKLSDVVQLPEFTDEEVVVEMGAEGRKMYADLRENFIAMHSEGVITASNAISKLLRLQQMTSGYAMVSNDDDETKCVEVDKSKSEALKDIIEAAPKDEPIVVFCRFVRDIREVHRVSSESGRSSFEISGAGNQQSAWEAECDLGMGPVIAVQIQAGGVGIDLTKSRYCVYYSLGFSLSDYQQSRARVHRPGQKRGVFYYHLIVPGTVDRIIYQALKDKRKVVDAVIEELTSKPANMQ